MLMHLLLVALPAVVLSTAPSFSVAPDPPVIGQQAVFTCQSGGSGYKIIKDTTDIATTETHTITSFATTDAGPWKCNADMGQGATDSTVKTVPSAAVATPTLVLDPVTPVEASGLTLTCAASDATGYAWKKDGSAFTPPTGVTQTDGVITWTAYAEADHKGTYQCQVDKTSELSRVIEKAVTSSAGQAQFSLLILSLGMLLAKSVY